MISHFDSSGLNILELDQEKLKKRWDEVRDWGGDKDKHADAMMVSYALTNAQLIVQKQLSLDLEASALISSINSVVWPSWSLQMRFEDDGLPTVHLMRTPIENSKHEYIIHVLLQDRDGYAFNYAFNSNSWSEFASSPEGGIDMLEFNFGTVNNDSVDDQFEADLFDPVYYMMGLCMKVLAYASIPHYVPCKLKTKAEKKNAGIHPNQHVNAPAILIRHLPRVFRQGREDDGTRDHGKTHRFLGRMGHLRYYEDSRYTNLKGTWQWIPPVATPDGIKIVYKVRKVRAYQGIS